MLGRRTSETALRPGTGTLTVVSEELFMTVCVLLVERLQALSMHMLDYFGSVDDGDDLIPF